MSEHDTLAAALVAALSELTNVAKKHRADNAPGRHTFANIADVITQTRPVLAEHDIVALTPIHAHGDELAVSVTLLHKSGDRLDFGPFPFPQGRDAQATGSWVTYMRRYALLAALGMGAEDEDDDGAQAQPRQRQERQERPQRQRKPAGSVSVAEAKGKVVEHLAEKVGERLGSDVNAHAKAVWDQAEVPVTDGKWVARSELDVLRSVADEYLADLAAMQPTQPELTS